MRRMVLLIVAAVLPVLWTGSAVAAPPTDGQTAAFEASPATPPPAERGSGTPAPKPAGPGTQLSGGALAAHLDGACNVYSNGTGDLCLWYFVNFGGSKVDFYYNDPDLWNNVFLTAGAGKGAIVANNTESGKNYDSRWTAWGCVNRNYVGPCGWALPGAAGNITPFYKNNVESIYWTL